MVTEIDSAAQIIATGNPELDQLLEGGIPLGSLVLLEGQSDTGKSLMAQYFTYSALTAKLSVAYYTTETTVKSLMAQMSSLDLDVTDYFLCDRLRVYPLSAADEAHGATALPRLLAHFETLPATTRLIIVDALTPLVSPDDARPVIDFFAACQQLGGAGRTIMAVVHSYALDDAMLGRVHSMCDAHLSLRLEDQGERQVKVMQVSRIGGRDPGDENIIGFDIEPGRGMKVIPRPQA